MTSTEQIDDGGPAFPESGPRGQAASGEGMSLRDWFAGQALTGLIAQTDRKLLCATFADESYKLADAMLKARKESK